MQIELVNHKRKRAWETLADAGKMFGQTTLLSTVNRIYYALFYQVSALLLTENLSSSKHSGIKSILNREFIKTGVIPEEWGKLLQQDI